MESILEKCVFYNIHKLANILATTSAKTIKLGMRTLLDKLETMTIIAGIS